MKRIASAIALMLVGTPAMASEWWTVSITENDFWVADRASLQISGQIVKASLMQVHKKSVGGAKYNTLRTVIDCKEMTLETVSLNQFDKDNRVVGDSSMMVFVKAKALPNTIEYKLVAKLCVPLDQWTSTLVKLKQPPVEFADKYFSTQDSVNALK
jgi:hypothetical protein